MTVQTSAIQGNRQRACGSPLPRGGAAQSGAGVQVYPNRDVMHRFMGPPESCGQCTGRGYYPVEDEPTDKYCDCPCGQERRRVDGVAE